MTDEPRDMREELKATMMWPNPLLDPPAGPGPEHVTLVGIKVKGVCPECGERSLVVTPTHDLVCQNNDCVDRYCLTKLLSFATPHHIVKLTTRDYVIQHPLRERKEQQLFTCQLDTYIRSQVAPPAAPGLYHAIEVPDGSWTWEKIG
ncbi:hypothetical protein SEA_SIXAMA_178 [Gordonia phage Sixama]|uniref:Uncharacterized protein n=1 Tax=Gordonia phage Sixama TaxID=2653271 RepID=A0A5Q2F223_9CAUD|nr:hypothetical protein PP302_gp151 [Gordonia phage Sixama]QGF20328.1 hypothetical protein SEA_SIXAMA_178 [Gordonia phage Sixama]